MMFKMDKYMERYFVQRRTVQLYLCMVLNFPLSRHKVGVSMLHRQNSSINNNSCMCSRDFVLFATRITDRHSVLLLHILKIIYQMSAYSPWDSCQKKMAVST